MTLHEAVCNPHMHTPYSDGAWYHTQVAEAALRAGLDAVIVTDHNVWVKGPERYYEQAGKRVLLLVGEEVHDAARDPQKNHLLIYGAERELAPHAPEPQALLDAAQAAGALTFIAHPVDPAAPLFHEPDLSWVNWEARGFTGLEIWNYMSEFKGLLTSRSNAIRYAFNPETGIQGPFPEVLAKWDELTARGLRMVGIGGADAHGAERRLGRFKRVIFPYDFLFRMVNTHLFTDNPLMGDYESDRRLVLEALARGHCFVGYDGAAPTRGFRFTANSEAGNALMGDELTNKSGVTLQIAAPAKASLRLLRNGQEARRWENQSHATHIVPAGQAGVFRVEAHLPYQGRVRGWIYSNPIYVRA
jgi:hypothetical protein